jgi:hypothetical protein
VADAIDLSSIQRPTLTCLGIASETQPIIDLSLVTDTTVQGGGSSTASSSSTPKRKPINMNVDDVSRHEWATLFLDWMYDNTPNHDQLTGTQIKTLAKEFNGWARVKGPPVGAYMFKWLRQVGITSTKPVRDQENLHPGKRTRQSLYKLPALEHAEVEATIEPMRKVA